MYLTDRQLRARLGEFKFEAEDSDAPFDADRQVGPCSIDLRLSSVYWTLRGGRTLPFRRRRVVDLERTRVMELSPRRGWRRHDVGSGDKITIKPGHMVLARTAERFDMPSDCAGSLEGRSSYARLGLSIHSTGSFINPGWRGYMPLTLANNSPVVLRIPVGTPLCQLLVIGLTEAPELDYAQRGDRKYVNDQGGPSLWWRDVTMREIQRRIAGVQLDERAFEELDALLARTADEEMLVRLENFIVGQKARSFGNADELLDGFAKSERRRRLVSGSAKTIGYSSWTVTGGGLLSVFLTDSPLWTYFATGLLGVASLLGLLWAVSTDLPEYLTPDKLRSLQLLKDQRRSAPPEEAADEGIDDAG